MGANRSMLELVSQMKEMGHDITVITRGEGEINKELSKRNIRNKGFKFYLWMSEGSSLFDWVKNKIKFFINMYVKNNIVNFIIDKGIDIIHTNSSAIDMGAKIAEELSIPHIWHVREYGQEDYNIHFVDNEYRCVKYMDESSYKVIFISKDLEKKYLTIRPDFKNNVVIYNGVDINKYFVHRIQGEFEQMRLQIVVCGLVTPNKNQLEVLKAINKLPSQYKKQIECFIIGSGDEKYISVLKRYVEDNNIVGNVKFLGYRDDVQNILKRAHVAVMPSRCEAFGRVTVEYMLSGLGVIVSNTGANQEIVEDKKTGLVYSLGDIIDLCNKILYYACNRKRLYEIANNGQIVARERFSYTINAHNIENVYKNVS